MREEYPTPRFFYEATKNLWFDTDKKEYLTRRELIERLSKEKIGFVVEQLEK